MNIPLHIDSTKSPSAIPEVTTGPSGLFPTDVSRSLVLRVSFRRVVGHVGRGSREQVRLRVRLPDPVPVGTDVKAVRDPYGNVGRWSGGGSSEFQWSGSEGRPRVSSRWVSGRGPNDLTPLSQSIVS